MTPSQLAAVLAESADTIAEYLFPEGKKGGKEWRVGSLAGEEGQSLGIRIEGNKAGIWCDFASGESGDLLDLWMAARGCTLSEAMDQSCDLLKIKREKPGFSNKEKEYADPTRIHCSVAKTGSAATDYLLGRGLSLDTLHKFKIGDGGDSVVFPYMHEDKPRMIKRLKLERINGKKDIRPTSGNQMPCLFGWQAVDPKARHVCITEGEIDAMSVKEMGCDALSVPFGGGSGAKHDWIENEFDRLDRFDTIYLCLDSDEEGRAASGEISERLGRHRCRVVSLGKHKDANEALQAGVDVFDFNAWLAEAKTLDPEELKSSGEYCDEVIREFYPPDSMPVGFVTPWRKVGGKFRFRPGEVTVLAGVNGHGKTEGAGHITLSALADGEKACVASLEFRPRKLLRRLVRQATCMQEPSIPYIKSVHEWLNDKLWIYDYCGVASTAKILAVFDYARRKYGINLFVIDNLSKLDVSMDKTDGQARFMNELMSFAKDSDTHIILIVHLRKAENETRVGGKMDVKGSGAITDLPDNCLIWWRNKAKEEVQRTAGTVDPNQPDAICQCEKQREGEDEPKILLWFDRESHQFLESPDSTPRRFVHYEKRSIQNCAA